MAKKAKSSLRVENRCLIAKNAWRGVNKVLNVSISKTSLKGKAGDKNPLLVKKTYGMLLESAGNSTIKLGKDFSKQFLQHDFINRVKGKYSRLIQNEKKKIKDEFEKSFRVKKIEEERRNVINRLKEIDFDGKINNLNNWLDRNCPDKKFIEKEGKKYKLLIYKVVGPKNKIKLFCSKYYQPTFRKNIKIENDVKEEIDARLDKNYHLQSLELFLKKDVIKKAKFFRKVGPLWADFEAGYVVERDEIDEIIENLDKNQFQLLVGGAASGKTAIASTIAYKLYKKGWSVSYLSPEIFEIFQYHSLKELKNEIDAFCVNNKKSLIIIQDFHRNAYEISYILERIENHNTRFLITTRNSWKIGLKKEKISYIESLCEEKILKDENFSLIADKIINVYKDKQKGIKKEYFSKFTSNHREKIEKVAKKNLWILSYLIEGWMPDKEINLNLVYKKVKDDIEDLLKEFKNKYGRRDVVSALLSLAPFSQYEEGVFKTFLNEEHGMIKIHPQTLDKLVEYGEIVDEKGFYLIPHSTLAAIYLGTAFSKDNDELLSDIIIKLKNYKSIVKTKEYPLEIIKAYIHTKPDNFGKLIMEICKQETSFRRDNNELKLYKYPTRISPRRLLLDADFPNFIITLLNETDLSNIGYFFIGLYYSREFLGKKKDFFLKSHEISKFINKINARVLISKANRESNYTNLNIFFSSISYISDVKGTEKIIKALIEDFEPNELRSKFEKNSAYRLESRLTKSIMESITKELVDDFINILLPKLDIENYSPEILWYILNEELYYLDIDNHCKLMNSLFNRLDLNSILDDWEEHENLSIIKDSVLNLGESLLSNKNHTARLIKILPSIINKEDSLFNTIYTLGFLANKKKSGIDVVNRIVNKIDIELFKDRLNKGDIITAPPLWLISYPGNEKKIRTVFDKLNLWVLLDKDEKEIVKNYLDGKIDFKKFGNLLYNKYSNS